MISDARIIDSAVEILNAHRIMAVSTVRSDGWPQTTFVAFANDGLDIYFLVDAKSQKAANIKLENRVSLAVGEEPQQIQYAKAVYAAALASQVRGQKARVAAWAILSTRHPYLSDFEMPGVGKGIMIRARCRYLTVLDYAQGLGHCDSVSLPLPPGSER